MNKIKRLIDSFIGAYTLLGVLLLSSYLLSGLANFENFRGVWYGALSIILVLPIGLLAYHIGVQHIMNLDRD